MSNKTILGGIICYFRGHKWRRLTKKERATSWHGYQTNAKGEPIEQLRICRRCGAERIAKSRKKTEGK